MLSYVELTVCLWAVRGARVPLRLPLMLVLRVRTAFGPLRFSFISVEKPLVLLKELDVYLMSLPGFNDLL